MLWKTLRNTGSILEDNSLSQKHGFKKARSFLQGVADEFARNCARYHDYVGELPFIYQERQMQTVLLPAVSKVGSAVLAEQPVIRKTNQGRSSGRIDYWVLYGNYVFLIEFRHAWFSARSRKVRRETGRKWNGVIEQIDSISSEDAKALCVYSDKVFKIGLFLVPCYVSRKQKSILRPLPESSADGPFGIWRQYLSPEPNWRCVWTLHERLQREHEFEDGRKEIYPFVFLNAVVKPC